LAGDSYQVNFTLPLDFDFQGSVARLYQSLRRNQSVSYGAWIRQNGRDILSFSPELFFEADASRVKVRPMKGTMSRGRTTVEDAKLRKFLANDLKNRSENIMIVDLLRNDLSRLLYEGGGGRVEPRALFAVETYESLLQMTSTVYGYPADNNRLTLQEIISSLFPCGSVTGAPKIRSMEIIRELEIRHRGIYCGALGYAGSQSMCFNVPIRTLSIEGNRGSMGIGSGIVADSDPVKEWQECLLKGNFLTHPRPQFQLIETLLWQPDAGFFLYDHHVERLADSAEYFQFVYSQEKVSDALSMAVADSTEPLRVRLLLHRDGRCVVTTTPHCTTPTTRTGEICLSAQQVDLYNLWLYHKTTQRDLLNTEYELATAQGYQDFLFCNQHGQITEGAISNVFIRRNTRETILLTPPLCCGLLAGTYRRMLLEQGKAVEHELRRKDLCEAREVYVANSVRGLVRVHLRKEHHET